MALVIPGKTCCAICSRVIETSDGLAAIPHVLWREHPLWRFSDGAVHCSCFSEWPWREYFEAILAKYAQLSASYPSCDRPWVSLSGPERESLERQGGEWEQWAGQQMRAFIEQLDSNWSLPR